MKINIQRLVKVCTSAIAVFTILVASLCAPALAAVPVLRPSDYITDIYHPDEYTLITSFRYPLQPLYKLYRNETHVADFYDGMDWYYNGSDTTSYRVRYYPLGYVPSTTSANGAVVDLSDFKSQSVIRMSYTIQLQLEFSLGGNDKLTFDTNAAVYAYWYDADFRYVSTTTSGVIASTFSYGDPIDCWVVQNSFDMQIPANAAYFCPVVNCRITDPDTGNILSIASTDGTYFDMSVTKDVVLDNSETSHRIEDELEDLNDNMDELVNGTPEQQEDYKDRENQMQDIDEGLNSAMAQLEALENVDTSSAYKAMKGFLDEDGWKDIKVLIEPIFQWSDYITIMLIVLSLVNLSVILFGR